MSAAGRTGAGAAHTELTTMERCFFDRSSIEVAPELLGCVLARSTSEGVVAARIVEVEAYMGLDDPASHAFRGKTARNAVMFGEPGYAYVYFTYGMHFCVNLVCQPAGTASAVLLRAGRVVEGADLAAARRGMRPGAPERDLARGPARLCQALGIDRALDGADVCDPASPLRILRFAGSAGSAPAASGADMAIGRGPRVGVSQAGDVPWRYWIAGDTAVSTYRPHVPRRRAKTDVTSAARDGSMQR